MHCYVHRSPGQDGLASCVVERLLSCLTIQQAGMPTAISTLQGSDTVVLLNALQGTLLAQFKQEAKARMMVLQKLNHINAEGTVLLKGRAACEIDTTDELLSTGVRAVML